MQRALTMTLALATGCVTFNGNELPKVALGQKTREPTAVIELAPGEVDRTVNGGHQYAGEYGDKPGLSRKVARIFAGKWKATDLIRDYADAGERDDVTHRLVVEGVVDERANLALVQMAAASLLVLPVSTRDVQTYTVTLERLSDGATYTVETENSWQTVNHLLFLVTTVVGSPIWGVYGAQSDLALHVYRELSEQGAFEGFEAREVQKKE